MILQNDFFNKDCLKLAPDLVGKILVRRLENGEELRVRITETEAYRGTEDKACHASKGRTPRTELLYRESGVIYVYLCYGVHWLMNIISGKKEQPQGVLFRAGENLNGPAKLTKYLSVDKSFNGESFSGNPRIRIEDDGKRYKIRTDKRVGIQSPGDLFLTLRLKVKKTLFRFDLKTPAENFIDITSKVMDAVKESCILNGICVIYCPHTTAGITINENADPDVVSDLLYAMNITYPDREQFRHSEGNTSAHLKALVTGNSVNVIIADGKLLLGMWQGIYFCEYDGPRNRQFYVKIIGEE